MTSHRLGGSARHRRTTGSASWLTWTFVMSVVVLLAAACGISADDEPQAIGRDDVPAGLLDPNPSTSTTRSADGTSSATVYLLSRSGDTTLLAPSEREVTDPGRPGDRIDALLQPLSTAEQDAGLISSIPSDTVLLDTDLVAAEEELVVDLSGALFDVQGKELANAFAQLVYTVTELEGVSQVRFKVDGEEYRAPNAEGVEQDGAVTRADYSSLAPGR
jgi:spore germination protein GerM